MSLVDLLQGEQRQTQIRLLFALGDKKKQKNSDRNDGKECWRHCWKWEMSEGSGALSDVRGGKLFFPWFASHLLGCALCTKEEEAGRCPDSVVIQCCRLTHACTEKKTYTLFFLLGNSREPGTKSDLSHQTHFLNINKSVCWACTHSSCRGSDTKRLWSMP